MIEKEKHEKKQRARKQKISAAVRNGVWEEYIGKSTEALCFCCGYENISRGNFECGHIVSEKEGGKATIQNLRPICSLCNKSMGKHNMMEFIKESGFTKKYNLALYQ